MAFFAIGLFMVCIIQQTVASPRMTVCPDHEVISILKSLFASNDTAHIYEKSKVNCTTQEGGEINWGDGAGDALFDGDPSGTPLSSGGYPYPSYYPNNSFGQGDGGYPSSGNHPFLLDMTGSELENLGSSMAGDIGKDIYAYASPWIIIIGLLGNLISLRVFTSRRQLRTLSASFYLIALSFSDSIVLLTYVLLEWLYKGLPRWPGGHKVAIINLPYACQCYLFLIYTFRFVSVYLIVIFTVERYIAVCRPLQRRTICTKSFARRIILAVHIIGALVSIYKPMLSGVFKVAGHGNALVDNNQSLFGDKDNKGTTEQPQNILNIPNEYICGRNVEYDNVNFVMELIYGLSITAVPFTIITVLNLMILQRLVRGDKASNCLKAQKNRIRLELTVMLLAISTSFILLNLPYFVVWVQQFLQSMSPGNPATAHKIRSSLYITKTIFNLNYAINFFVYCMTGTYYRSVIVRMLTCAKSPSQFLPHVGSSSTITLRTELRELSSKSQV